MDEESNRLAALLNLSTPANPGKPAPWTPPPPTADDGPGSTVAPDGPTEEPAAVDEGDTGGVPSGSSSGSAAAPAETPSWDPAAVSESFAPVIAAAKAQRAQLDEALTA